MHESRTTQSTNTRRTYTSTRGATSTSAYRGYEYDYYESATSTRGATSTSAYRGWVEDKHVYSLRYDKDLFLRDSCSYESARAPFRRDPELVNCVARLNPIRRHPSGLEHYPPDHPIKRCCVVPCSIRFDAMRRDAQFLSCHYDSTL